MNEETVWMARPDEPETLREVAADPEILVPLMVQGYRQVAAPPVKEDK